MPRFDSRRHGTRMDEYIQFTNDHPLLVAGLLVSFFLVIFTEMRRKASGLVSVETSDAVKLINNDALVLDLRNAEAHGRGHIVNAKSVPYDELSGRMDSLQQYKDKAVIAVCDAGMISTKAATTLRGEGFESAYGLKGGMAAWSQAGLPVVTGKKTKSKGKGKGKKS